MVTTASRPAGASFDTVSPATGEVIASFPVYGPAEVQAAVQRAREATTWWAGLDAKERRLRLLAWKSHMTRFMGRLARVVHDETGKPLDDATLEVISAILHVDWAAKHARSVLRPRRVPSGLLMYNQGWTNFHLGQAAATAWAMFLIVLIGTASGAPGAIHGGRNAQVLDGEAGGVEQRDLLG